MNQDNNYIDLGLPSGRLWAKEPENGSFAWDKARSTFGAELPSTEAFEELWAKCEWYWDLKKEGMLVKGPNGNTLFLSSYRGTWHMNLYKMGYWSCNELLHTEHVAMFLSIGPDRVHARNSTFKCFDLNVIRCREK